MYIPYTPHSPNPKAVNLLSSKIKSVDPGSPGQLAGILPGDTLVSINGKHVVDVLDYKFYSYDPRLKVELADANGNHRTLHIRKAEGQDLGLEFETYLMDHAHRCANNCVFCFVDQMPKGLRDTLYFKDDDDRLSFLLGNYVTLTNLSPAGDPAHHRPAHLAHQRLRPHHRPGAAGGADGQPERREIHRRHAPPGGGGHPYELPDRRLSRPQRWPCPGSLHAGSDRDAQRRHQRGHRAGGADQVPGWAVPPAQLHGGGGGCGHRPGGGLGSALPGGIRRAGCFGARTSSTSSPDGPIPEDEFYEDYCQLENGVGMLRLLQVEFKGALMTMDDVTEPVKPFAIATGMSAGPLLTQLAQQASDACRGHRALRVPHPQ